MRKVLIPVVVIALAIAAAAARRTERGRRHSHRCGELRQGGPESRQGRAALDRHRQPGLPAVVRRRRDEGPAVEDQRPGDGQGLRVGGRVRGREAARLHGDAGRVGLHAFQEGDRAGQEVVRLRHQPDLVHARAREGARLQRLLLQRQPVDRRPQGEADRLGALDRRPAQVQARRAARDDELPVHRQQHQAVALAGGLRHERRRGRGTQERPDRRARRRPADRVLRHRGAGAEREDHRPVRGEGKPGALRDGLPEGQPARGLRQQRPREHEGARASCSESSRSGSPRSPARRSSSRR